MKIIIALIVSLLLVSCTSINYRENKKVVIRKPKETPIKKESFDMKEFKLNISVNFDFDKWEIKPEEKEKLDMFIKNIKNMKGSLTIIGHTDIRGTNDYNDILSLKRARSIKEYLQNRIEFDNYKIFVEGQGKRVPLNKENTPKGMAENRRVEVTFKK